MRIFKLAILSLVFFFILITIISLFFPSNIRVTKVEQISASKETVMEQLSDPAKWRNWYPGLDSAELFYVDGIAKGVVQNKNKDQLIIITGKTDDGITIEYRILGKRKVAGGWTFSESQEGIMLQWYMTLHVRWYPWEKFAGMLYERSLGLQMKEGLIKLKEIAEAK